MDETESYLGKVLIAQPRNQDGNFAHSVVLIAHHNSSGAWGVICNKPARTVTMQAVMAAAGIDDFRGNNSVYIGGPVEPTRVHVIHTLDWYSGSTVRITDELGITGDVGILAAISRGEGPRLYRTGVGLAVWTAGQLEGEQSGLDPWGPMHRWLVTDSSVELCLTGGGEEQWQRAISQCVNEKVAGLF
jgi:putative transcriptional regulator